LDASVAHQSEPTSEGTELPVHIKFTTNRKSYGKLWTDTISGISSRCASSALGPIQKKNFLFIIYLTHSKTSDF